MNTATAAARPASFHTIQRPILGASIFTVIGASTIAIHAGTWIGDLHLEQDAPVTLPDLIAGTDYAVCLVDGAPVAEACPDAIPDEAIGGFHFAPGGNATARAGGDDTPAINPHSCWDAGFRPVCPDPRGMALVREGSAEFWCDIYLLGTDHLAKGTSHFGEKIADGDDLPASPDGNGKVQRCDFPTVSSIYAHHGKQLLTYDEFRIAASGVTEKTAAGRDPKVTGLDAQRTSRFGLMQATGNMWTWGTDGDPDDPRPSLFGGSWLGGDRAGSRYANLGGWPGGSGGSLSARGRSDHALPARARLRLARLASRRLRLHGWSAQTSSFGEHITWSGRAGSSGKAVETRGRQSSPFHDALPAGNHHG